MQGHSHSGPCRSRLALVLPVVLALVVALTATPGADALSRPAPSGAATQPGAAAQPGRDGDWYTWQHDLGGSRFNGSETAITARTVSSLKLKWAFAYPAIPYRMAKSQPAVVGGVIYFGSPDNKFYALDARTGATRWSFDLASVNGPINGDGSVWDGPTVVKGSVYFGDHRGYLYALDAHTGRLRWQLRLDTHPLAGITGSPLYFDGSLFVGTSSTESGVPIDYPCCTFRGQVVRVDASTGQVRWRHYIVPPARQVGSWPNGSARYEPSGGAVWATPIIDASTRTLFVGTGQNYSGSAGDIDSVLAVSTDSGRTRWKQQMIEHDTWRLACQTPGTEAYCPGDTSGSALDFDFGAMANLFTVHGRKLVGIGQKNGYYHAFDARTGQQVWRTTLLGVPKPNGGVGGLEWGGAYDGRHIYVSTWQADPGTLFALDPATGRVDWKVPNPADGCSTGGAGQYPQLCQLALTPAVSATPGLVYEGSADGKLRIFSAATGALLWDFDTVRDFDGVNGLPGRGSALSGNGGAVVSNGMLYVQSGYYPFYPTNRGYVLLAFALPDRRNS
jgi:polyvinyl alcohol dehydrogenase (cytochrome)